MSDILLEMSKQTNTQLELKQVDIALKWMVFN